MRLAGWRSRQMLGRHGASAPDALGPRGTRAECVIWRQLEGIEGHRTVITMESSSACQEWSIPGPQTA